MTRRKLLRIYVHTAADPRPGHDTSAAEIEAWHVTRGWAKIGYHFVVRMTGDVEAGRTIDEAGAGVQGDNARSIHVCLSGHGDEAAPTPWQYNALIDLLAQLCREYRIPASSVLGHREVNARIDAGLVASRYRTIKTCPGKKIDMVQMRLDVAAKLTGEPHEVKA